MVVGGSKCVLADGECRGRLEWHHAIKQQRLKREFPHGAWRSSRSDQWQWIGRYNPTVDVTDIYVRSLDEILADTRNRVWLCQAHHELLHNGRVKIELPESVWEFADEFGLRAMLENDLARAA